MNPTKYNHLFEIMDGTKHRLQHAKTRVAGYESYKLANHEVDQEYLYAVPKKVSPQELSRVWAELNEVLQ